MLVELAMTAQVIAQAADHHNVPTAERVQYEARCNDRDFKLTEEGGKLVLVVGAQSRDLSDSAFSRSYRAGSYIGRFTLACRRQGEEFTYSFFGVEIPQTEAISSAAGAITLNGKLDVLEDVAISRRQMNLVDFNKKRLERIPLK